MSLSISPLFSSSSGNCTYVGTERTGLIVDAGLAGNKVEGALQNIGKRPGELSGILITHEHTDHIRGVGVLSRKDDLPVYANAKTWEAMQAKVGEISLKNTRVIDRTEFYIGDICVAPVPIHHDAADPTGFAFFGAGRKVGVMTDTGHITRDMLDAMEGAAIVLLESNHDIELLKNGRYPYYLKKRILSGKGHLSNEAAGAAAGELAKRGVRGILLGHLSRENNRKLLAYETVFAALKSEGVEPGRDLALGTTRKSHVTGFYTLK